MVSDKFLLVSMDDEMAKSLADVLGNKTCKKIMEYMAEKNEVSEKDLANAFKIPINTVEYNLKKLLKSGFVFSRQNGSHKIYKHNNGKRATIPFHGSKILHPKVLKSIMKDADIPIEELIRFLKF